MCYLLILRNYFLYKLYIKIVNQDNIPPPKKIIVLTLGVISTFLTRMFKEESEYVLHNSVCKDCYKIIHPNLEFTQ